LPPLVVVDITPPPGPGPYGAVCCPGMLAELLQRVQARGGDWLAWSWPCGCCRGLVASVPPSPSQSRQDHAAAGPLLAELLGALCSGEIAPGTVEPSAGWRERPPLPELKAYLAPHQQRG
jgi:hypothetical protein